MNTILLLNLGDLVGLAIIAIFIILYLGEIVKNKLFPKKPKPITLSWWNRK